MVFGRSVAIRPPLYGTAHGCDNPGEHQHIDMGGARPQQGAGAGIDGGAGGEHVVDQHQPAAGHMGFFVRRHAEGALHIVGAFCLGQADLLRRGTHALERAGKLDPLLTGDEASA